MGKVKSFFRVLSCPKSNKARAVRDNQQIQKSISVEEDEECLGTRGDKFSFSAPVSTSELPATQQEPLLALYNQSMVIESDTEDHRDTALVALCNTLTLKIRQNLLIALLCLQRRSLEVHLCRHFVKKIVFIVTRNLENSARKAVLTLRHHGVPKNRDANISDAISAIGTCLGKVVRRDVQAIFHELRYGGIPDPSDELQLGDEQVSVDGEAFGSVSSSEVTTGDCLALCGETEAYQLPRSHRPRANTAEAPHPACAIEPDGSSASVIERNKRLISSKIVSSLLKRGDNEGDTRARLVKRGDPATARTVERGQFHQSVQEDFVEAVVPDKVKLGDVIFRNVIKGLECMPPAVVEQKANIVWELDFFTSEPYISYAYKSLRSSGLSRHGAAI
ncbi:iron-sulfur cluster biosynthesis domain containing protein, putative [Babesia caballi]|uniref:Iron-sulphur cluster biosynthesis domain containing protein, putative n=1 Tax=Babesia caballi TaxID=5871 RepID=A0AAV4LMP0_BABCB|nr:iron-sulphur cluster biosynthesis domain containing protein, putative [Babesia caballi]